MSVPAHAPPGNSIPDERLKNSETGRASIPPKSPAQTYSLFLPFVQTQSTSPSTAAPRRGVGTPSPYEFCTDLTKLQAGWFYDWSSKPPACAGEESVPMIWGSSIPSSVGTNSSWLLVWNEPNNPGQANLSPSQAASLFAAIEQAYPTKKLVVGNTYDGYGGLTPGIDWLNAFIAAYSAAYGKSPRISAIGMHCYDWTAAECIQTTQPFVTLAKQLGVQVWVTEFAFYQGWNGERTVQQVGQEMQSYLAYLQDEPTIGRYAWFANRVYGTEAWANPAGWNSPLVDADGNLTTYAQWYK